MQTKTKITGVVAATALALGGATAAYAYWSTSGSGTGTASTGTSTAVTLAQVGTVTALVPGGTPQAVNFSITNPATHSQYVSTVTVGITSVDASAAGPCTAADFDVVQPTAINADLANGTHTYSPSGATLQLKDLATNQDGCKGATVHLSFTAA